MKKYIRPQCTCMTNMFLSEKGLTNMFYDGMILYEEIYQSAMYMYDKYNAITRWRRSDKTIALSPSCYRSFAIVFSLLRSFAFRSKERIMELGPNGTLMSYIKPSNAAYKCMCNQCSITGSNINYQSRFWGSPFQFKYCKNISGILNKHFPLFAGIQFSIVSVPCKY